MKNIAAIGLFFIVACWSAGVMASDDVAGSIKSVDGNAVVVRGGSNIEAVPGLRLYQQDTLTTGEKGAMGIIFRDNSTLSLGASSTIVIDEFLFSPAEGKLGMITQMMKGTAVYLSGEIAKLAPESVKVETPLATIGIRGTRFMVQVD